jgi:hypothetical protein
VSLLLCSGRLYVRSVSAYGSVLSVFAIMLISWCFTGFVNTIVM